MQTNVNYALLYETHGNKKVVYGNNEKHMLELADILIRHVPLLKIRVYCIDTGKILFPPEAY
jgi:hypothetical protein